MIVTKPPGQTPLASGNITIPEVEEGKESPQKDETVIEKADDSDVSGGSDSEEGEEEKEIESLMGIEDDKTLIETNEESK